VVSRQCRGHPLVAVVFQSGSVEQGETYGSFTPGFAGSLIGKMGTRPRHLQAVFEAALTRLRCA
jgi:hypothetical protein